MKKKKYVLKRDIEKQENYFTYTFYIKNLNCANCAMKIDKQINKSPNVLNSNLDFVNKKICITTKLTVKSILKIINDIADKIEPGTRIIEMKEENNKKELYIKLLSLILGSVLFLIAYLNFFAENINVILFLGAYLLVGYEVIYKAFKNIIHGSIFDENFLMVIATFAAVYVKSYPEAVAVMLFYEVGELLQEFAVERSRKAIAKLVDIQPKYANILKNNKLMKVDPNEVNIDEIIVVKPGEKVPLDGIVTLGKSTIDSSQLTGESIPINVESNSEVLAGYINYDGTLTIRVTKKYVDTAVNKILQLVENAQSKKAKVEKIITKFARIYTPIVIFLAVLTVILPMLFIFNYDFKEYLYRGAIFLVVSCPCALVVSVPLSIFGGIGASSRNGILVKGGNYLDIIRKANVVVFDKTGTLTKGNFVVTKINTINNFDEEKMIELAQYAESNSNHVIGKAILNYKKINIDQSKIKNHKEIFGHGIEAIVDNDEVFVGNEKLMIDNDIKYEKVNEVGTIIYVAVNKAYVGYFVIADEIKKEAKETIRLLKKQNVDKIVMLTGDSKIVGNHVGKLLNVDEVYAELLPADKLALLEEIIKENNNCVMFVGDGVNDTPVMTRSDVGVSMGELGSDASIEVSDVVIMNDDLSKLVVAKEIAFLTNKKVWQNIIFALSIKIIVLFLSAFGLSNMWEAVFADVGVTIIAVINSISILKYKKHVLKD